jgi:hypothetical protein
MSWFAFGEGDSCGEDLDEALDEALDDEDFGDAGFFFFGFFI